MDSSFFDMLHDSDDDDGFTITDAVDIDFDRIFEELID